jgi:hypothetical protein
VRTIPHCRLGLQIQESTDDSLATGLTLASIIIPNWVSFENHTVRQALIQILSDTKADFSQNHHTHIHYTYGLHRRCSTTNVHLTSPSSPLTTHEHLNCVSFPRSTDCHGEERYFCSMWRSVGFLMSLGVVIEGMTIAAFIILLLGGKQRREKGWAVLSIMVVIAAVVQAAAMSLTVSRVPLHTLRVTMGFNGLIARRHIYMKTILASLSVGFSTNPGSCVRSAGVCRLAVPLRLQLPP